MLECDVFAFSLSYPIDMLPNASYVYLESNNLNINQIRSDGKLPMISLYDLRNQRFSRTIFKCSNFNGNINFRLVDERGNLLLDNADAQYNGEWVLVMKCKILE
jgi:hypothetical protein